MAELGDGGRKIERKRELIAEDQGDDIIIIILILCFFLT